MSEVAETIEASTNTDHKLATVEVPLEHGLQRGSGRIMAVTLRKPLGGALRGVNAVDLMNLDLVAASKVVGRISDPVITAQEYLTMEADDCTAIAGEIANFLLPKRLKVAAGLD